MKKSNVSANLRTINNLLSDYPTLTQPKFIIEHFRDQKVNPILCYQYASFIREGYEQLYKMNKNKKHSFTRKVIGERDRSFDVPSSFGDYLCLKRTKMFGITRQGFFDTEKINQRNSFFINDEFHLDLFDPETRSKTKANMKCDKMITRKSLDEFSVNQFYIKTFGWQVGIILSQLLFLIKINKKETVFFSDSELSRMFYLNIKTIKTPKIWNQDFMFKETTGNKFEIIVDLKKLISFIKTTKEKD